MINGLSYKGIKFPVILARLNKKKKNFPLVYFFL